MTPKEREAFYDAEIAPALMALCKRCEDNGISFLAKVEWEPFEGGTTVAVVKDASVSLRMVWWAMLAQGNADQMIMAMLRYGKEAGHNSAYLAMLERNGAKPS